MNIGQLLTFLDNFPKERVCLLGFNNPHSYRGYYEEAAVEPADNVTIGSMIDCLNRLLDEEFIGYKGGEYTYDTYTPIHLTHVGSCNDDPKTNGFTLEILLGFGNVVTD
jgi:hypothetical protein